MATVDGAPPIPTALKPVRVGDVESELAQRLRLASGAGTPVSRACALNLLVYVENAGEAQVVSDLIERVASAHPIRAIQMMIDARVPESDVRAWVSLECGDKVSGSLLCSEQIALAAHPNSAARLASAASALLVADVPVAFWWRGGSPFLSRLFKGVAPMADKIVVDSKRFGDGAAALDTLHRLNGLRGGRTALADMNWDRIATWRSTLSACFDDPDVLRLLPGLDRSEIEFSLGPDAKDVARGENVQPSARALLLAGWIVSRLPTIAGHGEISGKRSVWATRGAIVGLRLRSTMSRAAIAIEWEGADSGICATASDENAAAMRRWRFSPDPEEEMDLLYRCIEFVSGDPLLEAALEVG